VGFNDREDAAEAYCRVPPHEDTVPQSAEKGGKSGVMSTL